MHGQQAGRVARFESGKSSWGGRCSLCENVEGRSRFLAACGLRPFGRYGPLPSAGDLISQPGDQGDWPRRELRCQRARQERSN